MNNYLPTDYQNFIALSRYARWKEDEQRRETWMETVERYFDYMSKHLEEKHNYTMPDDLRGELEVAVLDQDIMPSMRALMTAGPALDRCHVGGYNCSYVPVDSPRAFDETMYILMCGTGVGFSVERHHTEKLPVVNEDMNDTDTVIKVGDSRPGWAKSLRELNLAPIRGTSTTVGHVRGSSCWRTSQDLRWSCEWPSPTGRTVPVHSGDVQESIRT